MGRHVLRSLLSCCWAFIASAHWMPTANPTSKMNIVRCPMFECPPELRPVQRKRTDYEIYGYGQCPEDLGIVGMMKRFIEEDNRNYEPSEVIRWKELMSKCCFERDICIRTCRMTIQDCHTRYHMCLEAMCNYQDVVEMEQPNRECVQVGMMNSMQSAFSFGENDDFGCHNYTKGQQEGCECVPALSHDKLVLDSMIDFYKHNNPDKLTDKKDTVKDMQAWKTWAKERPRMFLESHLKYRKTAVEVWDRWTGKKISKGRRQWKIVMGDMKSILQREAQEREEEEEEKKQAQPEEKQLAPDEVAIEDDSSEDQKTGKTHDEF